MDQYLFNLKCLRDWVGFDAKEQRIIIDYFKSIECINWKRISQCKFGYNIEEKRKIPVGEHLRSYLDKYNVICTQMKNEKIQYIGPKSYLFPSFFNYIDLTPEMFYCKGNLELIQKGPKVAIVGSRRPTAYGRRAAMDLTKFLVQNGVTVVSGLALGIDAIAHRTSLEMGGNTVAILASGLLNMYPKTNASIYKQILESNGLILSEKAFKESPKPYEFPLRNRLISAVSDAVIIIEAGMASGTLTTAQHALAQGKPIFALPGPIYSELSSGTNQLIYDGAIPLIKFEDILLTIGLECLPSATKSDKKVMALGEIPQLIYNTISRKKKMDFSEIENELKLENSEIISAVNELVIEGLCEFETLTEIRLV